MNWIESKVEFTKSSNAANQSLNVSVMKHEIIQDPIMVLTKKLKASYDSPLFLSCFILN